MVSYPLQRLATPLMVLRIWHAHRYSSCSDVTMHSLLIHEYYARLDPNALFLTLDTSLKEHSLQIRAHVK